MRETGEMERGERKRKLKGINGGRTSWRKQIRKEKNNNCKIMNKGMGIETVQKKDEKIHEMTRKKSARPM